MGDKVVIGSTDFDQNNSEEFEIVDCGNQCNDKQFKLDRAANANHIGKIDQRTGADQRAPVGILTRNIKIQGETNDQGLLTIFQLLFTRLD